MRYAGYLLSGEKNKWLNIEVTLGPDEVWIDDKVRPFSNFLKSFDLAEKARFQGFSGLTDTDFDNFTINNRSTLLALMLKLFVDRIGLHMIKEAEPLIGNDVKNIYINLAERLYTNDEYPIKIYTHAIYRQRGTPKTWLTLGADADVDDVAQQLDSKIKRIVTYVNHNMKADRRFRSSSEIDGQLIFMLTKYTGPRAGLGLIKNVEIASASHTLIVFNKRTMQLGVVSGSHKEIGHIHYYLRYKLFRNQLAPRRNEIMTSGNEIVHGLIEQPIPNDGLILKSLEVRNANLPDSPNLKISSHNNDSVIKSVMQLEDAWKDKQLSDMKNVEYYFMQRSISLYSRYDIWDRIVVNTRSTNIPNSIEDAFLERIKARLSGIDIKTTRLIQAPYTHRYILNKLLGQKTIPVDPAIPKEAEETLLLLLKKKIVSNPRSTVKRQCFQCFSPPSWHGMDCEVCGANDMRIVGEFMSLDIIEKELMKLLDKSLEGKIGRMVSYTKKRQRSNYKKHLIAVNSDLKRSTAFIVYVGSKEDIDFIDDLSSEGFGIVAIIDPKMKTAEDVLDTMGVDSIDLVTAVEFLLYTEENEINPLVPALESQQEQVLQRFLRRARDSVRQVLAKPIGYQPSTFEVDLKNLMQALVPDVVRLGTEHSGQKVPDGYLRYGLQAYTMNRKGRLFGWDAKYSSNAGYQLDATDLRKQQGYIKWLMDKKGTPYQFGNLGIYAIISNFSRRDQFDTVLTRLSTYQRITGKGIRIALVEDQFIAKVLEWSLANWEQVLINNSEISRTVFTFMRRKQSTAYTISSIEDWPSLKSKLDGIIQT